ncbi:cytochrome P450 [Rhypophila decipiens]|uniref:Cytochrome P450 n=1 Tax=Rhypophila decipiens TaxID=261697 RepID=A0AAN6XWJ5_9PEZI|nr:cytochrome P450 [Rhypophila decipiens]
MRTMARGNIHEVLPKLDEKYGPLCRIGPNYLLLGDLDELLRTNSFRGGMGRSDWFCNMRFDWTGDGMASMLGTAEHDARKAILLRAYEGRGEVNLERLMDSQLEKLISLIREDCLDKVVDWAALSRWFSLDIATLATMGRPWGSMDSRSDLHGFFQVADEVVPFMHTITTLAAARKITANQLFLRLLGPKRTDKTGIGKFMEGLAQADCDQEITMAAIAGADTSAIPIRVAILYITSTPYVYNKLKAEIAEGIKSGKIPSPIMLQEARSLSYLQAVLYEVFRILPGTSTVFAKRMNPGGDIICEYKMPEGTDVYPNMVALVRNKAVFGDDVEVFRPERWLGKTAEERLYMEKHIDMLFGHGRFMCPGKTLAWLELNKIFVEILRNFDVQIARPQRPWTMRVYSTLVISDLPVRFTEGKPGA